MARSQDDGGFSQKKKESKNNFDIMQYTPEQVQEAFEKQLDGRPPYFVWEDLPPTKVWYDATDNCFHTSVGISQEFEGYELDEVCFCLSDLRDKLFDGYIDKQPQIMTIRNITKEDLPK